MGRAARECAAGGEARAGLRSAWLQCPRWDDQVARQKALEAFRSDVRITQHGPQSWSAVLTGGDGEEAVTGSSPERLLDRVARIVLEGAVRELQAEHPGWRVWVSDERHWYAVRTGPGHRRQHPPTLDAASEAGLRAELAQCADADEMAP